MSVKDITYSDFSLLDNIKLIKIQKHDWKISKVLFLNNLCVFVGNVMKLIYNITPWNI